LLVVVAVLGHRCKGFELEDPDRDSLAVQGTGHDPVPDLMWLEPGDRSIGGHFSDLRSVDGERLERSCSSASRARR